MSLAEQMKGDAAIFTGSEDFGELVSWFVGGEELDEPVAISFLGGGINRKSIRFEVEGDASIMVAMAALPGLPDGGDFFVRQNGEQWNISHNSLIGNDAVMYHLAVNRDRRHAFGIHHD